MIFKDFLSKFLPDTDDLDEAESNMEVVIVDDSGGEKKFDLSNVEFDYHNNKVVVKISELD